MFAVCVHFDTMYIVMELCNFSLGQFINFYNNKSARINSKWRNKIFSDIVLGVRHLHSKQLLYCDMKVSESDVS
jgi:serine/threonine protein kinase